VVAANNCNNIEFDLCMLRDHQADWNGADAKVQGFFCGPGSSVVQAYRCMVRDLGAHADAIANQPNLEHGFYLQGDNHFFHNCYFSSMRNGFGGQMFGDSTINPGHKVSNCVFHNNKKMGLIIDGSAYDGIKVANCVFYDNDENGASVRGGGEAEFINCIANGNGSSPQFWQQSGSTLTQTNCLTTDPLFTDPSNKDFHFSSSSPCKDGGHEGWASAVDLEGGVRPNNGTSVDIGVYEFPFVKTGGTTSPAKLGGTGSFSSGGGGKTGGMISAARLGGWRSQKSRPIADEVTQAGWVAVPGGGTFFSKVDEEIPDEADYIRTNIFDVAITNYSMVFFRMSPLNDPGRDDGHVIRLRATKGSPGGQTAEIELVLWDDQGGPVATQVFELTGGIQTIEWKVPETSIDDIPLNEYDNLYLEIRALSD
jgi:hypothetical protein